MAPPIFPEVWVAQRVLDHIKSLAAGSPHIETGGILMGPPDASKIVVTQATGPGPRAIRTRGHFLRDTVYCQAVLDKAHRRYGWDYVGEWHSHVVPLDHPSSGDIDTLNRIMSDPDYGFRHFIMILAVLREQQVTITGHVVAGLGIESVPIRTFV